jgi:hypothetical protein
MVLDDLFLEGSAARIADRCSISARSVAAALKIVWKKEFKICVKIGNSMRSLSKIMWLTMVTVERWMEAFEDQKSLSSL